MNTEDDIKHTLLLVDDEPINLQVLRHTLQSDYRLLFAKDGETALEIIKNETPDLILLDIMMPNISGHDVCRKLKADPLTKSIPIIFITALSDAENEQLGLELGAVDYISKPFSPPIVKSRVKTHLSLVQVDELIDTRMHIVRSLGKAAGYKDNETGMHIVRMSHYAYRLAKELGFNKHARQELFNAAPMHDVGKIGIPDSILLKPGKLTPEEWEVMRQHTTIGAKIIGEHRSSMLRLAVKIASYHHEKWDGSGYPHGLKGEEIPLEARIISIVDVFDALTSVRPYKKAWTVEEASNFINESSGTHFDPVVVMAFNACLPDIVEIMEKWSDS